MHIKYVHITLGHNTLTYIPLFNILMKSRNRSRMINFHLLKALALVNKVRLLIASLLRDVSINLVLMLTQNIIHILFAM